MHFAVLTKKKIIAFLSLAFAGIICLIILSNTGAYNVYFGYAVRELPIYRVEREDNKIAISFDCAWGNDYTDKLLEIMEKEAKRIEKIQAKEAKKVKEEKKNKTVANAKAKGQIAFGKGKKMSYDITSDNMRNHFISSAKDYGKKAKKLGDERLSSLTLRYNDEAMVKEERMIAPDSLIMNDMIPYIIKEEISVNQYPITLSVFRNGEASDMTFNNQQEAYAVFGLSQPMQNIETKEIERR